MRDGLRVSLSLSYDLVMSWDAELTALTERIARPLFCHRPVRPIAYVMAVPVDLPLATVLGGTEPVGHVLDRLLALGEAGLWERRSCGAGTKGIGLYDWASVAVGVKDQSPAPGYAHTVLMRRAVANPSDVEFFLAHAPQMTAISELIKVAGMRWKIEENNEHGKDLLGLTQYQVRKWTPWHRHVTIAMLALAFLAVTRARLIASDTAGESAGDQGKEPLPQESPD
jgi:hypothetical protein